MNTRILPAAAGMLEAAEMIRQGELVAFATETVYGLGADATNGAAVAKIYEAKGRPSGNPLIVHVPDVVAARECVSAFGERAGKLAAAFWPGALTMVLPRGGRIAAGVSAGRGTVAIRCPAHKVADALLRTADRPIAAPSANRSGFTSPTTAQHVYAELAGRVGLILDGGPCSVGVESTVLDLMGETPVILRPGAVTREMIEGVVGRVEAFAGHAGVGDVMASPGMLERHYAPRTVAYRFGVGEFEGVKRWVEAGARRCVLLTFDPGVALGMPHETMVLPADAAGYARVLYDSLRAADERGAGVILVLMPGTTKELWSAIVDRLTRATVVWRR